MHSKLINPRRHGRFVFHNRASCRKTVAYLGHEAREQGRETEFFNDERTDIPSQEVEQAIDDNTKGLRKSQEKFYSLVLSPSADELQHVGRDPQRWQDYTRQVMQNYATNFRLPNQPKLASSDLVWFATLHQERKEKQGPERGKSKGEENLHIHVLVSAKDKTGRIRLHPRGSKSRFSIRNWQVENGQSFQQMFGYQKATTSEKLMQGMPPEQQERHRQRIRDKVTYLNEYFVGSRKIDVDRTLSIGQGQQYGKGFFFNLHHLTKRYQEGRIVSNPYRVLETGKDEVIRFPERMLLHLGKGAQAVGQETGEEHETSRRKKRQLQRSNPQQLER